VVTTEKTAKLRGGWDGGPGEYESSTMAAGKSEPNKRMKPYDFTRFLDVQVRAKGQRITAGN
jgi:hypothetical protein